MRSGTSAATGTEVSAAVAIMRADQAVNPTTNTHTRAVPRTRIVARSARYSSVLFGVIKRFLTRVVPRADNSGDGMSPNQSRAILAQLLARAQLLTQGRAAQFFAAIIPLGSSSYLLQ